jgi:methionyl-tRNA formyltransferase
MYAVASPHARNATLHTRLMARLDLSFLQISDPRELTTDHLRENAVTTIFFPHWSWHIPRAIHEHFECVIFHMTDVPFGRGGSPVQNLIARGYTATKISAIRCVEEVDAGPVYLKRDLALCGTAEEILLRADGVIESMIVDIIEQRPLPEAQIGQVTQFPRRKPEEGNIEHCPNLNAVHDLIRMLDGDGYPPAFIEAGLFRLEFSRSSVRSDGLLADVRIRMRRSGESP